MGHEVSENEWSLGRSGWGAERNLVYQTTALDEIALWGSEVDIEVIQMKAFFVKGSENYFFPKDGHLTKFGHDKFTQGLWMNLEERVNEWSDN